MIDFALAFASASAASVYEGLNALFSGAAFTLGAVLFALFPAAGRGAAFVFAAAEILLLRFVYAAYGAGACLAVTFFASAACAAGERGICGTGRILFFISVPFILLMPFFGGEAMPTASAYHLPLSLASGACAAYICKTRPVCSLISGSVGAAVGCFMRACGGVGAELVTYAGIFFLTVTLARGIITCAKRT